MYFGILNHVNERTNSAGADGSTELITDNDIQSKFVAPLQIMSNRPVFSSDTLSLKRVSFQQPVQRWEIETNLMPTNDGAPLLAHSVVLGKTGAFDIRMPQPYTLKYSDADYSTFLAQKPRQQSLAGSNRIWFNSVPNIQENQFIRFNGHSKVYLVVLTGTDPGNSNYPFIDVFPNLVLTVPADTNIFRGGNVVMKVYYDDSVQAGIKYTDGILADPGSVKLIEAL